MKLWPNMRGHGTVLYKDVEFKSQLEVRWAAWLDLIGVKWDYEAEQVPLEQFGERCHRIPDFTLHLPGDERIILEIKPEIKPGKRNMLLNSKFVAEELLKMMIVANQTELPSFIGFHNPGIDCTRYGTTKNGKNRSKVVGIYPTTDTVTFERIYFDPKLAHKKQYELQANAHHIIVAHHYVTPTGFQAWYFPSLKVLVCPTVYFRLTNTNRFYVGAQKPLRLTMKEFSAQTYVRKNLKFKENDNDTRFRTYLR